MYCRKCGEKVGRDDKFCKHCGQGQNLALTTHEEVNNSTYLEWEDNKENTGSEQEAPSVEDVLPAPVIQEGIFKKIFRGIGVGGLIAGGGFLAISFTILQFLFVAFAGLSMIGLAISLFSQGSIIWGLVVLFIGTPIAIGIASYFFIFIFALSILALIIWGITSLFGFNVSLDNIWDGIWLLLKVLILGGIAFSVSRSFVEAIKNKDVISFFKENWFYILLFFFLFAVFF